MWKTTSMLKLILFVKNHLFLTLAGVVIVLVVVFSALVVVFQGLTTPRPPKNPKEIALITPIPQQKDYKGATFTTTFTTPLPKTALLYTREITPLSTADALRIAQEFNMSGEAKIYGGDYYWEGQNPQKTLQISPNSRTVVYNSSLSEAKPDSVTKNEIITSSSQLIPAALKIAKDLKIDMSLAQTNTPLVQYMVTYSENPKFTKDFTDANVFLVSFPQALNNVQLYKQHGEAAAVTIIFDRLHTVRQITYTILGINPTALGQASLINLAALKDTIVEGKGFVKQPYSLSLVNGIQSASFVLTKAELGYLIDPASSNLQPVFVSSGVVKINSTLEQEAIVYVPAVK